MTEWIEELQKLPDKAKRALELDSHIREIAEQSKDMPLCFFLGRGADAAVALEAALKLKEVAYVPTQESPAGEMKHGPLALVQPDVVSVFGATDPATLEKVVSNMKEVQARGGTVIAIATEDDTTVEKAADRPIKVPATPYEYLNAVLSIIPLQLFAYHVALSVGTVAWIGTGSQYSRTWNDMYPSPTERTTN